MPAITTAISQRFRWALVFSIFFTLSGIMFLALHSPHGDADPLTPEERTWLKAHQVIRFAPDPDFPPAEYFDNKGTYNGITADYLALMEKKFGMQFRIIRLRNWDEVISHARTGQIDLFTAAETPQRLQFALFTPPYIELPAVIIAREKVRVPSGLSNLKGMNVSVVSGYAVQEFVARNFPGVCLDVVADVQTALRKVSLGTSDAFVENLATASYYIEREGITNLRVTGESGYSYRMAFASRKDWPILNSILTKGLEQITADEKKAVCRKWISLETRSVFASKGFRTGLIAACAAVVLLMSCIMVWNRTLAKQVSLRTGELEQELAERKRMESELREARDELEQRVGERTSALTAANKLLQREIKVRNMAEEQLKQKKELLEELNGTLEKRVREEVAKNRQKDIVLVQQNRQAAMGEMLDHIAHQWKQPITSLSLIVQDVAESWSNNAMSDESVEEAVGTAISLLEHMSQTIDVFRNFYRPDKERKEFNIKDSIDRALTFIAPALKFHRISVELEADPEVAAIGFPNEYTQVLLNILTNARDAVNARGVENPIVTIKAFVESNRAVVTIMDNAGGIPEPIIGRVFELYFSTREPGCSSGVGLYMSKNIIERNMGGVLTVANADQGARFRIELAMPH